MEFWILPLFGAIGSSAYSRFTACDHVVYKKHSQKGSWQTELHKNASSD